MSIWRKGGQWKEKSSEPSIVNKGIAETTEDRYILRHSRIAWLVSRPKKLMTLGLSLAGSVDVGIDFARLYVPPLNGCWFGERNREARIDCLTKRRHEKSGEEVVRACERWGNRMDKGVATGDLPVKTLLELPVYI